VKNLHVKRGLVALGNGLIEEALVHFERAVRIKPLIPGAYLQLGACYLEREQGDRTENIRKAKECFLKGLRHFAHPFFPVEHARFLEALGDAHGKTLIPARTDELEQAITCHQKALEIFQEQGLQEHRARLLNKLGCDYCDRIAKDLETNLYRAITCFKKALKFYVENRQPESQAQAQMNLGTAYRQLPSDNGGTNLRQALCCFAAALQVWTKEHNPEGFASLKNNIANVYMTSPFSLQNANKLRAITAYQEALDVMSKAHMPHDYSLTEFNLGQAYLSLSEGDWETYLKQAMRCFGETLKTVDNKQQPSLHAHALSAFHAASEALMQKTHGSSILSCLNASSPCTAVEKKSEDHTPKNDERSPKQESP
jgi:tetratricopeptide (TPR) repeat protein